MELNSQASPIDVAQNERDLFHLCSKRRHIRLNVVIHTQSSKELVQDWKGGVASWNTETSQRK